MMMKHACKAVVLCLFLAAPVLAADANGAHLRGRVLQVRDYISSGGVFRREIMLFTQTPNGGPYSPLFSCSPLIADDCEVGDLITGCTPVCESEEGPDSTKLLNCHCPTFNAGAGACVDVTPFHDGFVLLATEIDILTSGDCTSVP